MNNIETAKMLYDYAVARDWEGFKTVIHPDFRVIESEGLSYAGVYRGVDGFQEVVSKVFNFFERFEVEPVLFTEGEDHVIALVRIKGTGKKSGADFESDLLELFRFEHGKVIEIRPYYWHQQLVNTI